MIQKFSFSVFHFGQVVVVIGGAASAVDISRDIATVAKEVHIADRSIEEDKLGQVPGHDNMWLHSTVKLIIHGDGWMAIMSIHQFV